MLPVNTRAMFWIDAKWAENTGAPLLLYDNPRRPAHANVMFIQAIIVAEGRHGILLQSTSRRNEDGFNFGDFKILVPWHAIVSVGIHPTLGEGNSQRVFGFVSQEK